MNSGYGPVGIDVSVPGVSGACHVPDLSVDCAFLRLRVGQLSRKCGNRSTNLNSGES